MKRCRDCGVEKPLTEFGKGWKRADGTHGPDSYCRPCRARRQRERRQALRSTPEGLAKSRADEARWKRAYYRRHRDQVMANQRAWWERVKADPERYRAHLENDRIDRALRRERQGLPPRGIRPARPRVVFDDPHVRLPVAPFVEWLATAHTAAADDSMKRRVFAYLHGESRHVAITAADAILTANGFHLADVYPSLYRSS